MQKIDRNLQRTERVEKTSERMDKIKESVEKLLPLELEDAQKYLSEESIKTNQFRDLYGKEVVNRDNNLVTRLKQDFAENHKKILPNGINFEQLKQLSDVTEAYLLRGFNEGKWIPHCNGIKTSDYDDYVNGVDMVLEYDNADSPARHIGLGIDVTFASNVEDKLAKIKREIETGALTSIKYFDSPNSHFRGELKKVPRAVAGFDIDSIRRLARLRQTGGELPENDPLRFVVLHQLDMQMKTFSEYASKKSLPSQEVLSRTSKFITLLYSFVKQNNHYDPELVEKNVQVKHFAKTLRSFSDL